MEANALFDSPTRNALTVTEHVKRKRPRRHPKPATGAAANRNAIDHVHESLQQRRKALGIIKPTDEKKKKHIPEIATSTELEKNFRHGHWKERRNKIITHLKAINTNWMQMARYENCGAACCVERSPKTDRRRLRASYCRSRHCEPCMRAKANLIAANLKQRLRRRTTRRYRFITFTLKHTDQPLAVQIKRLYAGFRKIRQDKLWKKSPRGGCFTLEVKHNGTHWHPHLHVIDEGDFIPFKALSDLWLKVTGDSHVVDIRQLKSGDDAAHYVTKYVTKGVSPNVWESSNLAEEWVTAVKGVRQCATYGDWRGFKLKQVNNDPGDWIKECTLDELLRRAADGEAHAKIVRDLLVPASLDPEVTSQAR